MSNKSIWFPFVDGWKDWHIHLLFKFGFKHFLYIYFCTHTLRVLSEAVAQRCSVKEAFLEISQNSQEKSSARVSFLIKPGLQLY